jgi:CRISPR-associated protein Cas1
LKRIEIENRDNGERNSVPIEDISIVICAAPDTVLTGGVLQCLAERKIVLLVCDEKYRPGGLLLPYYAVTDTAVIRSQIAWSEQWKQLCWQRILAAKIGNQAGVLPDNHPTRARLLQMSCAVSPEAWSTDESTAARRYWRAYFPLAGESKESRKPRSRQGLNGMLDYGYAVLRSAVLRSLAVHGFIAALGIHHSIKPSAHALADDLVEPLRPFIDRRLLQFATSSGDNNDFREWVRHAAAVLTEIIPMPKQRVKLLNAIDIYVNSLADASLCQNAALIRIPALYP